LGFRGARGFLGLAGCGSAIGAFSAGASSGFAFLNKLNIEIFTN
jgi:hypothetical protein